MVASVISDSLIIDRIVVFTLNLFVARAVAEAVTQQGLADQTASGTLCLNEETVHWVALPKTSAATTLRRPLKPEPYKSAMYGISIYRNLLPWTYDPNRLLDLAAQSIGARNDSVLAQRLRVARSVIHGIRSQAIPVTPSFLLWLHDASGMSIDELRSVLGDQRHRIRLGLSVFHTPSNAGHR